MFRFQGQLDFRLNGGLTPQQVGKNLGNFLRREAAMRNLQLGWRSIAHMLVVQAAALLLCSTAFAQVKGFVVVNPIVVCDSSGQNCPPFGVICSTNTTTGIYSCTQSGPPSTATVNTPIGFVDGDTNTNLTRAILAGEAGIDVAFFPVVQYNSLKPITNPWQKISP